MLTFVSLIMMIDFEGQISTSEMKSIPPCINTYSTQDLILRTDMICVKKKYAAGYPGWKFYTLKVHKLQLFLFTQKTILMR